MRKGLLAFAVMLFGVAATLAGGKVAPARQGVQQSTPSGASWRFAVSGDSRNCGDVVMPAIAAGVARDQAAFYWHLGDFRAIYTFDEDIEHQPEHLGKPLTISDYENLAWQDFIDSQLAPFGKLPVFLAMGNHEAVPPKTRERASAAVCRLAEHAGDRAPAIAGRSARPSHEDLLPLDRARRGVLHAGQRHARPVRPRPVALVRARAGARLRRSQRGHDRGRHARGLAGQHRRVAQHAGFSGGNRERAARLCRLAAGAERGAQTRVRSRQPLAFLSWTAFSTRNTCGRTGACCPDGSSGRPGRCATFCRPTPKTPTRRKPTCTAICSPPSQPSGEIHFDFKKLAESDLQAAVGKRYQADFVHWCFAQNTEAH